MSTERLASELDEDFTRFGVPRIYRCHAARAIAASLEREMERTGYGPVDVWRRWGLSLAIRALHRYHRQECPE